MNRICFYPNRVPQNEVQNVCLDVPAKVLEGEELYDTLCPVSKLTGHRMSVFKLLGKLTGAKADLLNAVLQELPTVASDPRLSDQDRADFLVSRLCSGTPAENAIVAEKIMNDLDALGLSSKRTEKAADSIQSSIDFDKNDNPDVNE